MVESESLLITVLFNDLNLQVPTNIVHFRNYCSSFPAGDTWVHVMGWITVRYSDVFQPLVKEVEAMQYFFFVGEQYRYYLPTVTGSRLFCEHLIDLHCRRSAHVRSCSLSGERERRYLVVDMVATASNTFIILARFFDMLLNSVRIY